MVTHPTFVVGAGRAGVNVMKMLQEVAEQNDETDKFSFVAVDSDGDTLNNAPPSATRFTLDIEDDFLGEDLKSYPYLTRSMKVEGRGAKRQRPVGRYKLDNKGKFDSVRTGLRDELRSHFDSVEVQLGPQSASFNIFYIHSLGGGTGSGTYPLLAGILSDVAGDLNTDHVYMAGVGVAPIVLSPDEDSPAEFPGRPIYYPNAYASLNDLEQLEMLDFEDNETRELLIQSQGGTGETESFVFDRPPFDDYWLIGVNERRVQGGLGNNVGPETYRGELNQTIARSLHAITQVGESAENWTQGRPVIGTLDQATISVPDEQVRTYCELKSKRENLKTRYKTEIPNEIERIEGRKAELEEIKSHLDPDEIVDEQLKEDLLRRLETDQDFRSGKWIIDNKTVDDVEAALQEISADEEYDIESEIIAADILDRKLREEEAVPQIEQEHKDIIQNLWSKYSMQNEPGGGNVRALATKARMLDEYLREQIADHEEILEEWDPNIFQKLVDAAPPLVDMAESEREHAEEVVDELQSDYDDLDAIRSEWGRAEKMRDAVGQFKQGIRKRIQNQIDEKNDRITELQNERDELNEEIRELTTNIEDQVEELTTASLSRRIAVLPLERTALEDLDEQRLEQFDDMEKYVGELVDREKTRNALSQRLKFAEAWNNYIIDGDFDKAKYSSDEYRRNYENVSQDEMWLLHSENTGNLLGTINTASDADVTKESGGDLQYLTDPYRIEFVSFTRRGPVSRLKLYQVLSRHAENGEIESLAGNYDDHRQAFAYPEWYDRDVQEAFDISAQVAVTKPPELNLDRVDKPDLSEGKLKNYVKTNGLDSYVWEGMMWDTYRETEAERFVGWKEGLREKAVGFTDLQKATPDADLKARWMAGQADWEDIVTAYRDNLVDRTGVELQFGE